MTLIYGLSPDGAWAVAPSNAIAWRYRERRGCEYSRARYMDVLRALQDEPARVREFRRAVRRLRGGPVAETA